MPDHYNIAILGAGITGVMTAFMLREEGMDVILIDKSGPGTQTSFGNAGILADSYITPFAPPPLYKWPAAFLGGTPGLRIAWPWGLPFIPWMIKYAHYSTGAQARSISRHLVPLVKNTFQDYAEIAAKCDATDYLSQYGRLLVYRSKAKFNAAVKDIDYAATQGIELACLNTDELFDLEPCLQTSSRPLLSGGILSRGSGRVTNPSGLVQSIHDEFIRCGGVFKRRHIPSLKNDHGKWHLRSGNGDSLSADHLVLCTGPWANDTIKKLGYHFPIAFKRGYNRHFNLADNIQPNYAIADVENGYVLSQTEYGIRLTTGVEITRRDAPANATQICRAEKSARQLINFGPKTQAPDWFGNRPCTPDSLPIIGRAPHHQNLWFNFAHGHIGLTAAPNSARIIRDLITRKNAPYINPVPYSPNRYRHDPHR